MRMKCKCTTQNLSKKIKRHTQIWDFDIQKDLLISTRRPDLVIVDKKKRTCGIVDFAVPTDQRVKLKESEKKDQYLDLARELKSYGTWKRWCYQL